jgi:two-component system nitrogen regulation sensor histidine kinase NtrY
MLAGSGEAVTSLKARLILAFSLITVIPLAVAMVFLTVRIESMVRTQAAERLGSSLGGIEAEIASDGKQLAGKLEILARDPLLKRLYLLRPGSSRDLSDYLAERQFLLGLDFLSVADSSGAWVSAGPAPAPLAPQQLATGAPVIEPVEGLGALVMTAGAPIRYQSEAVGSVQGGLLFDAAFLRRLGKSGGVDLILRDGAGRVVAATLPAAVMRAPRSEPGIEHVNLAGTSYLARGVPLKVGAPPFASITGLASTAAADRAVASLQLASALLGLLGLGIAIPLAILWSGQISRPVEQLAAFSEKLARGEWEEPLTLHSVGELKTLVDALDRMRRDLQTYRDKLVTSERQAAWSQMARKVAHEVKNPLTPIAISVADLKRSYDQKRSDFPEILDQAVRTVGEEVETLRRLLQEFSDFARIPAPRLMPCQISRLIGDIEALYGNEIAAGRLVVARPAREITFIADAGQIRQMLINLIKNALEALNGDGRVKISAARVGEALEILVSDSGPGLSEEQRKNLFVPGFTTKTQGSGLGLTIVERIVSDHQGAISVDTSRPGEGTTFRVRLPLTREGPK